MATVKINKVKAFREALGIPQHEMSRMLSISQPSYNRKEKKESFLMKKK